MSEPAATQPTAAQDWDTVQAFFPVRKTSPRFLWNYGLSSRMHRYRLRKLLSGKGAGQLANLLRERSDRRIKALRTFAAVNHEQATAAFRITVVINVTIPVLFLTVLNILTPGSVPEFIASLYADDPDVLSFLIVFTSVVLCLGLFVIGFSVASLGYARDIRHLIDLFAAERGIYFGLEEAGDLHSP